MQFPLLRHEQSLGELTTKPCDPWRCIGCDYWNNTCTHPGSDGECCPLEQAKPASEELSPEQDAKRERGAC